MIITFNARENHYKGKQVIDWYKKIPSSERSRKIIDILYAHSLSNEHIVDQDYPSYFYNSKGGGFL